VAEDHRHDAGATPAAVRRVHGIGDADEKHKHAGSSARVIAPRVRKGA
jgi:hypothetical protein